MSDQIVEEVRRIREEHAAQFNYDIDAIFADFQRLQASSGQPRISPRPRRPMRPPSPPSDRPETPFK
jgi:hypothetical protein